MLERIAADLDNLGLAPNDRQADKEPNQNDPQSREAKLSPRAADVARDLGLPAE